MALLYGSFGRLTAKNGGFRTGQLEALGVLEVVVGLGSNRVTFQTGEKHATPVVRPG